MWSMQPAGRRHDDVHAGAERALLGLRRAPAVDGDARDRRVIRESLDVVVDLDRQLARRRQDEHRGAAQPSGRRRPARRARIRRSRIGSTNAAVLPVPVSAHAIRSAAARARRDDLALDRRGLGVTTLGDRREQRRVKAERLERHALRLNRDFHAQRLVAWADARRGSPHRGGRYGRTTGATTASPRGMGRNGVWVQTDQRTRKG